MLVVRIPAGPRSIAWLFARPTAPKPRSRRSPTASTSDAIDQSFGIDQTRWETVPPPPPGAAPRAIFIGRLVAYKGLDILLRALERVPHVLTSARVEEVSGIGVVRPTEVADPAWLLLSTNVNEILAPVISACYYY